MVEFDIRGLFDNLDHGLSMAAPRTRSASLALRCRMWLKADEPQSDEWSERAEARRKAGS